MSAKLNTDGIISLPLLTSLNPNEVRKFLILVDRLKASATTTGATASTAAVDIKIENYVDLDIIGGLELLGVINDDKDREIKLFEYLTKIKSEKSETLMIQSIFSSMKWDLSIPVEERIVKFFAQVSAKLQEQGWMKEINDRGRVRRELLVHLSSFLVPVSLKTQMTIYVNQSEESVTIAEYYKQLLELAKQKDKEHQLMASTNPQKPTKQVYVNTKMVSTGGTAAVKNEQTAENLKLAPRVSRSIACWRCKKFGHKYPECPGITQEEKLELDKKLNTGVTTRKQAQLRQIKMDPKGNVIMVKLAGISCETLLDTGADMNFINTSVKNELNAAGHVADEAKSSNVQVELPNGKLSRVSHRMTISIRVFNQLIPDVEFWVLPELTTPVILGDTFLKDQGVNIKQMLKERIEANTKLMSLEAINKQENRGENESLTYVKLKMNEEEEYNSSVISIQVPDIDKLFPVLSEEPKPTPQEKQAILDLHKELPDLLYNGNEPMAGTDFAIRLKIDAIPFVAKGRRFPPDAYKNIKLSTAWQR